MAWVSKYLTDSPKSQHKKFPGFELWLQCLEDNPAAWAEMRRYNKQDVIALEKLYLRQLPWIADHPNLAAYSDKAGSCPKCGGAVSRQGTKVHQSGKYQQYKCKSCGGWSRSRINAIPHQTRKAMLVAA